MSTTPESPPKTLKDFLLAKADEYGVRDRIRRRKEWLDAVRRLYEQLKTWMREADPEGLLDVVPYEVQRTEHGLGTFDAPALQVCFGPAELSIEPMSSGPSRYLFEVATGRDRSYTGEIAPRFQGRVDISNGLRKYNFLREAARSEVWRTWDGKRLEILDQARFEAILKELLA